MQQLQLLFFTVSSGEGSEAICRMDLELVAHEKCKRCAYINPWYQQSRSLNGGKDWVVTLGQEVVAFQGVSPDQLLPKSSDSLQKKEQCRKELTTGQDNDEDPVSSKERGRAMKGRSVCLTNLRTLESKR